MQLQFFLRVIVITFFVRQIYYSVFYYYCLFYYLIFYYYYYRTYTEQFAFVFMIYYFANIFVRCACLNSRRLIESSLDAIGEGRHKTRITGISIPKTYFTRSCYAMAKCDIAILSLRSNFNDERRFIYSLWRGIKQ